MLRDVQNLNAVSVPRRYRAFNNLSVKLRELQMRTIFFLDIPRLFEELGKLLQPAINYTSVWQTLSIMDRERERNERRQTDGLVYQFRAWKLSRA
jgi:hypothetical protein